MSSATQPRVPGVVPGTVERVLTYRIGLGGQGWPPRQAIHAGAGGDSAVRTREGRPGNASRGGGDTCPAIVKNEA